MSTSPRPGCRWRSTASCSSPASSGWCGNTPLADTAAKEAAPIGACFTFVCLVTGSLWGRPMWGTWWAWDPRLTSVLILFFLYLGYMALWSAIEDRAKAARAAAILCIVGVINIPIIRFSVDWWNSLHQGPSVVRFENGRPCALHRPVDAVSAAGDGAGGHHPVRGAAVRADAHRNHPPPRPLASGHEGCRLMFEYLAFGKYGWVCLVVCRPLCRRHRWADGADHHEFDGSPPGAQTA